MTEPTSAEKNRVVAERWMGIRSGLPNWVDPDNGVEVSPYPDIPNDPVAADALEKALAAADYEMEFSYARGMWTVDLGPYEAADWTGMAESPNKLEAFRDAVYDAAMAERSEG